MLLDDDHVAALGEALDLARGSVVHVRVLQYGHRTGQFGDEADGPEGDQIFGKDIMGSLRAPVKTGKVL